MEQIGKKMTLAALFAVAGMIHAEENPNRLHGEYMARKQTFGENVIQAKRDFDALRGNVEWKLVIDRQGGGFKGSHGACHIELEGKTGELAERYPVEVLDAALWDDLEGDKDCAREASIVLYGKRATSFFANAFSDSLVENCRVKIFFSKLGLVRKGSYENSTLRPRFSGFDSQAVQSDIIANPSRQMEYIEAIVKILADPEIRYDNPLEVKNLLSILDIISTGRYLGLPAKAEETVPTFIDYIFWDQEIGEDYRLQEKDLRTEENGREIVPQGVSKIPCYKYLPELGKAPIPNVLWRFANATEEERRIGIGGGGTPLFAMLYFRSFTTVDEALGYLDDFKRANAEKLTDTQKEALDEIVTFIKEKRFRSERLSENSNPSVRTWAPSYGKGGVEE